MKKLAAGAVGAGMLVAGTVMGLPAASASGQSCNSQTTRTVGYRSYQYLPSYKGSTSCLLGLNSSGTGVKSLQNSLNYCYGAKLKVDGKFGPKTRAALIKAQKKAKTKPDGVYGPKTRDALKMRTVTYFWWGSAWSCTKK